ncbi:(3R)-hydroxymyristoyl-[acyl-carrier-protein] dehydratase [Neorickettsia helminthoeca str. Oregon]|uniref:3-hydroxyacyl-[acyl-carrier-protein] dehydratase FabZ n=1 Tax=Neorickettsia helminthoeca str. Oregon TaxID=1286528 RepID=X5H4S4_9RICK|nr:3-hydroxyacyl-ACP dehydratase FabZ [Neorickettsia helminthoeca]AHX11561.1 (3R)-hydroxymyristoyl-[acyl-carrier-protein] dehydratase [Neorickettsia helminthoeca str. Oregon]
MGGDIFLDKEGIKALIPHRDPFLFLDEVLEVNRESRSIVCRWDVSPDAWFFQGHFPDFPITPGVLIVESLAQAAGVYAMLTVDREYHNRPFFFASIEKVKFKRPVSPGAQLRLQAVLIKKSMNFWKFDTEASAGGEVCAEAVIMATIQA